MGDPHTAVWIDVDIARQAFPPSLLVAGAVYDVSTGLIKIVRPAGVAARGSARDDLDTCLCRLAYVSSRVAR